jgi:ADP-ribose pyrophosphatase YjhB (NUDIX family)
MTRVHLASGLAIVDDAVLLVASSYPSHPLPLWNLPGGRQIQGELLRETVQREVYEETGLSARVARLAYLSESYDGDTHFLSTIFEIDVSGTIRTPQHGDHVVGCEWCPIAELPQRLEVAVVREPLIEYLSNRAQYFGYHDAGITIRWP